jgi:predicted outer membrane lipoprotein
VWILGVLVTAAFAALAALAGSEWNVFEQLDLPRIPVDEGTLTTGGAITLVAIVLGTLLAGIAGGKVGERFHRKVDRVGFDSTVAR